MMTVSELSKTLSLVSKTDDIGEDKPVTGCYIGDLLSWVMGRAPDGCVWITVMGNINAVAVAQLADISCIILCENAHLDDNAKSKAELHGIPVYSSELTAYGLAVKISSLLGESAR